MPTLTVLYGHAYDGKHEEAFRKCLEKIRRNEGDSCVYLVRSDVRVRQLRDLVLRELSGCFHFPVATFPDFIKKLYRKRTGTQRVISTLEQKLLIEDIFRQRERECGTQFYFTRFRDHPGILSKIMEFITGVRRIGIASPQELAERLRDFSGRRQQIYEELVGVFERYEERLRAVNAIDDTGIFLDVAQQAVTGQLDIHSYIFSPELLVLEGYYELTLPEQQILSFLCSQFERSILTLDTPLNPYHFPDETETPKPFRVFRKMMDYIQESGFSLREFSVSHRATEAQRGEHPPTPLKGGLSTTGSSQEGKGETFPEILEFRGLSEQKLSVKSYRDKKEEVTEIAREIRTLYREGEITALHDVGVTFPVIEQYERLVREIFPLFGIPFTMFQGYSLASSPVVVTIFRLLQVILDGYSREAMGKLFSSPLVEFGMTEGEMQNKFCTPLALNCDTYHHLDSLARSLGIVGGKEEWEEKLTQYYPLLTSPIEGEEFKAAAPIEGEEFKAAAPIEGEEFKAAAPIEGEEFKAAAPIEGEEFKTVAPIEGEEFKAAAPIEGEEFKAAAPIEGQEFTPTAHCPLPTAHCPLPTVYCLLPTTYSLLNFLSRFETERPRPPEELIELLIEGIQQFQIPQRVMQSRQRTILENDASALQAFLRILNTLQQELSSYHRKSAQPSSLTLQEFSDLLRTAVQGETYYLPETLDDSVFIMGRLDTRQVQFKYLFFGGLVERDFPGQDEPNIFLSEQEAEALGLPTYKKRVEETDHLFYLNLLNPTEKLYLSYPLQEGETDLLRSAYIEKVIHWQTEFCNGVQDVSCQEGQDLSQKTLENIFTYTELYQWLGTRVTQKVSVNTPLPPSREEYAVPLSREEEDVLRFIKTKKGRECVANFLDGLQAQRFRTSKELSHFDGILISHWSKSLLHRSYSKHIYSASEFDQYVRCPIKFFFQRILYLEPLQDISTEIPAFTIGTLLHRIVSRFYTGGVQNVFCQGNVDSAFLQRKTDKEQWIREASIRMENIIREELNSFDRSGVFWERFANSLLAGLHQNGEHDSSCSGEQNLFCKKGLLATFIELEANDTNKVMPCYLNAHFGMPVFAEEKERQTEVYTPGQNKFCTPKDYTPEAGFVLSIHPFQFREKGTDGKIVSLKIRGEIDRIDLEPESSIERETPGVLPNSRSFKKRRVVIYDYKTGSVPSLQKIKDGLIFQLPLYLLAVQHFLGEDYEVVAGGYYQLKSPNDIGKKGHLGSKEYSEQKYFKGSPKSLFDTHEEFLKLLEEYKKLAVRTAQAIKEGRFHPTLLGPQDAGCSYCEYNRICRVDHQQMKNV